MGELKTREFLPYIIKFVDNHFDALSADEAIWRQTISAAAKIGGETALSMLLGLCAKVNLRKKGDIVKAVGALLAEGFPLDAFVNLLPGVNYLGRGVMLGAIYERRLSVDKAFDGLLRDIAIRRPAASIPNGCRPIPWIQNLPARGASCSGPPVKESAPRSGSKRRRM